MILLISLGAILKLPWVNPLPIIFQKRWAPPSSTAQTCGPTPWTWWVQSSCNSFNSKPCSTQPCSTSSQSDHSSKQPCATAAFMLLKTDNKIRYDHSFFILGISIRNRGRPEGGGFFWSELTAGGCVGRGGGMIVPLKFIGESAPPRSWNKDMKNLFLKDFLQRETVLKFAPKSSNARRS